jgi:hypothetical protein
MMGTKCLWPCTQDVRLSSLLSCFFLAGWWYKHSHGIFCLSYTCTYTQNEKQSFLVTVSCFFSVSKKKFKCPALWGSRSRYYSAVQDGSSASLSTCLIFSPRELCLEVLLRTNWVVFQYFRNFRDAAYGSCNFYITLLDCFHAVKKVSHLEDAQCRGGWSTAHGRLMCLPRCATHVRGVPSSSYFITVTPKHKAVYSESLIASVHK